MTKRSYIGLSLGLFFILVFIAFFIRDAFIRPFLGDVLVVVFLYFFACIWWRSSKSTLAILTLIFAFLVELAQYFQVVDLIGLAGNRVAEIVIGTTFSWGDMLAYIVGVGLAYAIDTKFKA